MIKPADANEGIERAYEALRREPDLGRSPDTVGELGTASPAHGETAARIEKQAKYTGASLLETALNPLFRVRSGTL